MKRCQSCGHSLNDYDKFCAVCGSHQSTISSANSDIPEVQQPEPFNKLCLELAYSGILFWLPLVFSSSSEKKVHANRGLWLLILATISCGAIQFIQWITGYLGNVGAVLFKGAFLPFLLSLFFLTANSVKGALAIHCENDLRKMLWFDEHRIIGR